MFDSFNGIRVQRSIFLEGSKRPVFDGENLFVSPAMMSLLETADEKELEQLLRALRPLCILKPSIELPVTFELAKPADFERDIVSQMKFR